MVPCRLCKTGSLLRNSHIIPEFLYSALYDEKHRFHKISVDENQKNTLSQKGVREFLLCGECEQKLSKYERYASLVLNGGLELTVRREGRLIHLEGIDYNIFKLFALSILWRASVSSLDVFDQVTLGPHEETLRKMVFNGESGKEYEYPFILSPIIHEGEVQEALIVQPTRTKLAGHQAYRFVFGGLAWVFLISSHRAPDVVTSASISSSGKLTMLPWELADMKFIVHMAQELSQQGKL